jgi:hypothetical protein
VRGSAAAFAAGSVREAAPWIIRLARLGYAAKGVVYIVIGVLAARLAFGVGGDATDSRGALREIAESSAGQIALMVIGVGLIGYAVWRLIAAATDAEGKGSEAKGIAQRAGQAWRGLVYGALGVEALRLLGSSSSGGGEGEGTRHWTARVLELPFGRWLVMAAGAGVIAYALYQFWRAAKRDKVRKHLDLGGTSPEVATWIVRLGRFGVAARGVVFVIIGWFLIRAALRSDPSEAGGVAQSLALLGGRYGALVLATVAIGLVAYGIYQLANARYRRIRMA